MTSNAAVARFDGVSDDRGAAIRARRKALGMTAGRLASLADVSREHLSAVENGHKSPTEEWARRVELAMDAYQHETGQDEPDPAPLVRGVEPVEGAPQLIRVQVPTLHEGRAIVVEGPVDDPEALAEAVEAIMRRLYPPPTTPEP
jgi:transcriptional regulator with XRE-family HTH domain